MLRLEEIRVLVFVLALMDGVGNAILPLIGGVGGSAWFVSPTPLPPWFIGETSGEVTPNEMDDCSSDSEAMTGFEVLSEVGVSVGLVPTNVEVAGDSAGRSGEFSE